MESHIPDRSGDEPKQAKQPQGPGKPHSDKGHDTADHSQDERPLLSMDGHRAPYPPEADPQEHDQEGQEDQVIDQEPCANSGQECQQRGGTNATQSPHKFSHPNQ